MPSISAAWAVGQSGIETQLDQLRFPRMLLLELLQGFVQPQDIVAGQWQYGWFNIRQLDALRSPPRLRLAFCLARSIKIRRIASAAAAKKCRELSQGCGSDWSISRTYASCTGAVACNVCPGRWSRKFSRREFRGAHGRPAAAAGPRLADRRLRSPSESESHRSCKLAVTNCRNVRCTAEPNPASLDLSALRPDCPFFWLISYSSPGMTEPTPADRNTFLLSLQSPLLIRPPEPRVFCKICAFCGFGRWHGGALVAFTSNPLVQAFSMSSSP